MLKDYKLKKTLDGLLLWVGNNETDTTIPTDEKFLYRLFNGEVYDGYNFLVQARSIIGRTNNSSRKLETRMQYDPTRTTMPTIHITLPADNVGKQNSVGMGLSNDLYTNDDGYYHGQYQRGFNTNYDLIVTSGNANEAALIYELLMHLFIAAADTLNQEFDLFSYKGREMMMNNDAVPDRILMKTISLNVEFKRYAPSIGYYGQYISEINSVVGNMTYTLTVTVVNVSEVVIQGVNVTVGNRNTQTDASGQATFTLLNDDYVYEISYPTYVTQTDTVTMQDEDATLDIILILE
jgi:hypothetical protein